MKKSIVVGLFAGLTALVLAAAAPVSAQTAENFAIIDVQRILKDSLVTKDLRKQAEKFQGQYVEEIKRKENELRSVDEELQRQSTILSPEKLEEKRQEFAEKIQSAQREVSLKQKALNAAYSESISDVELALEQVVQEIANKRNIAVVLTKSQTFYVGNTMQDITDEAMVGLNRKLPTAALKIPK